MKFYNCFSQAREKTKDAAKGTMDLFIWKK